MLLLVAFSLTFPSLSSFVSCSRKGFVFFIFIFLAWGEEMDKETNQQENPSLLPNHTTSAAAATAIIVPKEESPRKPLSGGGAGGDRLKRDEWSEGAVSSLLEAYESKWVLRNRAKLKGHDWEDVARYVSARANCTKLPKTQTQCKNKIESMKKRYRSESTADASSWPLYSRLDLLLRGGNGPSAAASAQTQPLAPPIPPSLPAPSNNSPLVLVEPMSAAPPLTLPPAAPSPPPPPPPPGTAQNSHGSNGVDRLAKEGGAVVNKILSEHASDKNNSLEITSDSSTPALYSEKAEKMRLRSKTTTNKMMRIEKKKRKRKELEFEIAESIRWLAEAVVKSEQARMEAMREIERMRAEAEAKRAEMDLKRTEIIANTQLEIARLFAAAGVGKAVDSSLRIGRN